MGLIETLIAAVGALLTLAAGWFKLRADHYKGQAERESTRADQAEARAQISEANAAAAINAQFELRKTARRQAAERKEPDLKHRDDLEEHW